jgi:hypothetical protein
MAAFLYLQFDFRAKRFLQFLLAYSLICNFLANLNWQKTAVKMLVLLIEGFDTIGHVL